MGRRELKAIPPMFVAKAVLFFSAASARVLCMLIAGFSRGVQRLRANTTACSRLRVHGSSNGHPFQDIRRCRIADSRRNPVSCAWRAAMTLAETGLRYWRDELQTLQEEIAGNNFLSSGIDPALNGDLRKAVRRIQQYQKKVARQKLPA